MHASCGWSPIEMSNACHPVKGSQPYEEIRCKFDGGSLDQASRGMVWHVGRTHKQQQPVACSCKRHTLQAHACSLCTGTGAITYGSNGVAVLPSIAAQKKKLLWGKKPDPDLPVGTPLILAVSCAQPMLSTTARVAGVMREPVSIAPAAKQVGVQAGGDEFGANEWGKAEFSNHAEKGRFEKLMVSSQASFAEWRFEQTCAWNCSKQRNVTMHGIASRMGSV